MKGTSRKRQSGLALLVVVAALALGGTFLVLSSLNAATWRAERYRVTQAALAAAKEALIARAVADDNRPGSLPCPDTNDDGSAELFAGTACPSYIGRLPWRTLDLPDLRDGSGERLWYALSPTHRDHAAAEPINSDTVAQLNATGMQVGTNALAIVLAPAGALIRAGAAAIQNRSCTVGVNCNASLACTTTPHSLTPKCNPFSYLDISGEDNADGDDDFVSAAESETFNDRLVAILADDVMPLVEKRAAREIATGMAARYVAWQAATGRGFYPWAAPFADPANPGAGVDGTLNGHLPVTNNPLVWNSIAAPPLLVLCDPSGTQTLNCTGVAMLGGVVTITGSISNVGTRFTLPPVDPAVSGLVLGQTWSWTVNTATQSLDFSFTATIGLGGNIQAQVPVLDQWATSAWLTNNQWNQLMFYALAPAHAVDGSGACSAANCISVGGGFDKEAVLLSTGRALMGQAARPPAVVPAPLTDYLDGPENTNGDLLFVRMLRTADFNDQPMVVRP